MPNPSMSRLDDIIDSVLHEIIPVGPSRQALYEYHKFKCVLLSIPRGSYMYCMTRIKGQVFIQYCIQ